MAYLRILLIVNLVFVGLLVAENINRWWNNPGTWSKEKITEQLVKELNVDQLELTATGEGQYAGAATLDGQTAFEVTVRQNAAEYDLEWTAISPEGRQRDGSPGGGGPGRPTKDTWLFALYLNVAVAAMLCGARAAQSFKERTHRDLVAWLGIPLFLVVLFFSSAFSESRLGDNMPWQEHAIKWLSICVLFFAIGLFGRHTRMIPFGTHRSLSQQERNEEEAN